MKTILFSVLFLLSFASILSQEKQDSLHVKTNPIIYATFNINYVSGLINGLAPGYSLNYQNNRNLFTFRFLENENVLKTRQGFFPPNLTVPYTEKKSIFKEYSLLYGKRFIKGGFSYHISAGISYNDFTTSDITNDTSIKDTYFGFPLEIGCNWFNAKKEVYKAFFGTLPVRERTSFGRSIGFKLFANIAKESFVGLSLNIVLGWHKKY